MGIQLHVDKPPWASQVTDGFTKLKLLRYLVNKVVCRTQKILAKREPYSTGQQFSCSKEDAGWPY